MAKNRPHFAAMGKRKWRGILADMKALKVPMQEMYWRVRGEINPLKRREFSDDYQKQWIILFDMLDELIEIADKDEDKEG